MQPFADVLQNKCSKKFHVFYRKTLVLESPFNKVAGLMARNFIKKRLQHICFPIKSSCEILRVPLTPPVPASEDSNLTRS